VFALPPGSGQPLSLTGAFDMPDVVKPIYDEINKLYGTKLKPGK
jgi:hypothetical protein